MKQRLVGTLILGCLALIFIPLLLDGEGISPSSDIASIPPEPELSYSELSPPERPQLNSPQTSTAASTETGSETNSESDSETATATTAVSNQISLPKAEAPQQNTNADTTPALASTTTAIDTTAATTPQMGADGLPEAWSIRLGIFGERANADALMRKLLDADYKAYSRPVTTAQGGTLTAIFVGPVLTRAEANTLVGEFAQKFKVNGIVVQFQVEELQ